MALNSLDVTNLPPIEYCSKLSNAELTSLILEVCEDKSITNQILFNTITCRLLDTLKNVHGFTNEELVTIAKKYSVVFPWSRGYCDARQMLNFRFQLFPLIIAYVESAKEIAFFIKLARKHNLKISVRGGKHSAEGWGGAGELVIDTSRLPLPLSDQTEKKYNKYCAAHNKTSKYDDIAKNNVIFPSTKKDKAQAKVKSLLLEHQHNYERWITNRIDINTENNTLRVASGLQLGYLYTALINHGRIYPAGQCPGVAAGGLFSGGGFGPLLRKYGYSCDSVLEIKIVLANGKQVTANGTNEYKDLFQVLRGGGNNNYGVVTEFKTRVYPHTHVLWSRFDWDMSNPNTAEVLHRWSKSFLNKAPKSVSSSVLTLTTSSPNLSIVSWYLSDTDGAKKQETEFKEIVEKYWFSFRDGELEPANAEIKYITMTEALQIASGLEPQSQPFYKARSFFVLEAIPRSGWRQMLRFMSQEKPFTDNNDGSGVLFFDGIGKNAKANDKTLLDTTVVPTRNANSWMGNYTFWRLQKFEAKGFEYSDKLNRVVEPFVSQLSSYSFQDNLLYPRHLQHYFDGHGHISALIKAKEKYDPNHIFSWPLGVSTQVNSLGHIDDFGVYKKEEKAT